MAKVKNSLVSDITKYSFYIGILSFLLSIVFIPFILLSVVSLFIFIVSFIVDAVKTHSSDMVLSKEAAKLLKNALDNYVIVDIETTGLSPQNYEIIEISAIKIFKNDIIDTFSKLVNPKGKISKKITDFTGITNDMVENQPYISEILPDFIKFVDDNVVVAHNAPFDLSFICRDAKLNNIEFAPYYIDTLELAKNTLDLKSYKLIDIAKCFKISSNQEHRGLSDCELLYECYTKMNKTKIRKLRKFDVDENVDFDNINIDIDPAKIKAECEINAENPLYNKNCVITGEISNYSRSEIMRKIINCGGICQNNITKQTDILIVGKDAGKTKIEKANEKITKGQNIQFLNEKEFLEIIK